MNPLTRLTKASQGVHNDDNPRKLPQSFIALNQSEEEFSNNNSFLRDSPLSQISSATSFSPGSQQSQNYRTAIEFPQRQETKKPNSTRTSDTENSSPLFPNWREKNPSFMAVCKNENVLSDTLKHGGSLLSNLSNGSPFQKMKTVQRNGSSASDRRSLPQRISPAGEESSPSGSPSETLVDDGRFSVDEKSGTPALISYTRRWKRKISVGMISFMFLLSIASFICLLALSCRSDGMFCLPQFSFQFDDSMVELSSRLDYTRDLLNLLSFIAVDLGSPSVVPNEFLSSESNITTVDSISSENVYGLSFHGYCRDNLKSNTRFCTSCNGMNVLTVLIRDSGIQLLKIAKRRDFKKIGNSFVLAFNALSKKLSDPATIEDGSPLKLVQKAEIIDQITKVLWYLSFTSSALSLFNTTFILILLVSVILNKPKRILRNLQYFSIMLFITGGLETLMIFTTCALEFEYVFRLSETISRLGILVIAWDIGLYILIFTFLISLVSSLFTFTFYRLCHL